MDYQFAIPFLIFKSCLCLAVLVVFACLCLAVVVFLVISVDFLLVHPYLRFIMCLWADQIRRMSLNYLFDIHFSSWQPRPQGVVIL